MAPSNALIAAKGCCLETGRLQRMRCAGSHEPRISQSALLGDTS